MDLPGRAGIAGRFDDGAARVSTSLVGELVARHRVGMHKCGRRPEGWLHPERSRCGPRTGQRNDLVAATLVGPGDIALGDIRPRSRAGGLDSEDLELGG
jgi:hypothetical protein